jgi:hypothetical protein
MLTKDEEAIELANKHYQIEGGLTRVIQINSTVTMVEPDERIILLEVNSNTVPAGIMPLHFSPVPSAGIHYPSVIMEVTPDEYEQIQKGDLKLPNDWTLGEEIPKPADNGEE